MIFENIRDYKSVSPRYLHHTKSKKLDKKNPDTQGVSGFIKSASTYSPTIKIAVPSAQSGLTSLFGMGRGGP